MDLELEHYMDDKVWMYKEIMMNDDNLESNLLTSSLLKMRCLVQVELCVYYPVAGDELTVCVFTDLTLQVNLFRGNYRVLENDSCGLSLLVITVYPEV